MSSVFLMKLKQILKGFQLHTHLCFKALTPKSDGEKSQSDPKIFTQ